MKNTIIAQDKEDLKSLIEEEIKIYGNHCNLNHIDTSLITDMSFLFLFVESKFNGNIIQWNVSNVTTMNCMFAHSQFNGDISRWNTGNVTNMSNMFYLSKFNGDISGWNVSNVKDMHNMFQDTKFNKEISDWDVRNVINMDDMFNNSQFNKDISIWNVENVKYINKIFNGCNIEKPWWAIEDDEQRKVAIDNYNLMQQLNNKLTNKEEILNFKRSKI